jgi:hypothetical protein
MLRARVGVEEKGMMRRRSSSTNHPPCNPTTNVRTCLIGLRTPPPREAVLYDLPQNGNLAARIREQPPRHGAGSKQNETNGSEASDLSAIGSVFWGAWLCELDGASHRRWELFRRSDCMNTGVGGLTSASRASLPNK